MFVVRKVSAALLAVLLAATLAGCGSSADGSGTQVVEPAARTEQQKPEAREAPLGTRQNPVPLGTMVQVGPNWQVAVLEINPDAWEILQQENMFNEPPEAGKQYVMARLRISYAGDESGTPWIELATKYLGSDGNTYSESCGVTPDPIMDIGEQFPGAVAEGYECWVVPSHAVKGGAIIVEESFSFADTRVFFAGVR